MSPLAESLVTALSVWHLRAAAVFAVLLLVSLVSSGAPARVRHRWLAWGLLGAAVVPLLAAALPSAWTLEISGSVPSVGDLVAGPRATLGPVDASLMSELSPGPSPSMPDGWPLVVAMVWGLGVLVGVFRVGIAIAGARMLRLRSLRPSRRLAALAAATRLQAKVRLSHAVDGPVVVGVLRPIVLLPASANDWSDDRLRSVLLHEQGHVAQGDHRWFVVVRLVRALLWIDPLAWWASRRFFAEAEYSADDHAVRDTVAPSGYATALLDLACPTRSLIPLGLPSMSGSPSVAVRIRRILGRRPTIVRPRDVIATAIGALGALIVSIVSSQGSVEPAPILPLAAAVAAPGPLSGAAAPEREIDPSAGESFTRAYVSGLTGELRSCYEEALRTRPEPAGKMTYALDVAPSGGVTDVRVTDDTLGLPGVRACTEAKIRAWKFSAGEDAAEVSFSVVFSAG